MAITFSEFETTPAGLIAALKDAILASADWSEIAVADLNTTTTSATTTGGTTVNLSSVAGIQVGTTIVIAAGTANERVRVVTAVAGNTITVDAAWGVAFASGTTVSTRTTLLKCTSTNGADLFVNLEGEMLDWHYMGVTFHRAWTGTNLDGFSSADRQIEYLYWKASTGTSSMPIHVTVSAGKDHLFIGIEGPRPHEASTTSTTYGSIKNYIFASALVPYHVADAVPCWIVGGTLTRTATSSAAANSHQVSISRDSADTNNWSAGRLATLAFPSIYSTDVIAVNRACTIDGEAYLLPYVMFSESEGIRGRLKNFFYANTNAPSPATDYPDPVNSYVDFDGVRYKLIGVNKGDGSTNAWGPFGSIAQSNQPMRSIIVAVPYSAVP